MPHVTCICLTYDRPGKYQSLLEESIECFLRQDLPEDLTAELLVVNDCPEQILSFSHPRVRIQNRTGRFPTLSEKIQYAIDFSKGDFLCRWDDDDISLPHRLRLSYECIGDRLEWRPNNHWYDTTTHLSETVGPGNSHTMALWRRSILEKFPDGKYPQGYTGNEDQKFNQLADSVSGREYICRLPKKDIFYLYRWGVSPHHLSAVADHAAVHPHQSHYDSLAAQERPAGNFELKPRWLSDHVKRAAKAATRAAGVKPMDPFGYGPLLAQMAAAAPGRSTLVYVAGGGSIEQQAATAALFAWHCQQLEKGLSAVVIGPGDYGLKRWGVDDVGSVWNIDPTDAAKMLKSPHGVFFGDGAAGSLATYLQAWDAKNLAWVGGGLYLKSAKEIDNFFGRGRYALASPHNRECWTVCK